MLSRMREISRCSLDMTLAALIPAILSRLLLAYHFTSESTPDTADIYALAKGTLSELLFIPLLFMLLLPIRKIPATVKYFWMVCWCVFYAGNVENILHNGSNLDIFLIAYVTDAEFISGSLVTTDLIVRTVAFFVIAFIFISLANLRYGTRKIIILSTFVIIPVAVATPDPEDFNHWVTHGVITSNTKKIITAQADKDYQSKPVLSAELLSKYLGNPNDGTPRFTASNSRPNILLVFIESLRNADINKKVMPNLAELAEHNIHYNNFYAHRDLTIRGLYSSLSGNYPNLLNNENKADIIGLHGTTQPLLPEILNKHGYNTVFLQSATLGFMRKDLFAKAAGFQQVFGEEHIKHWYHKGGWGVDDRALYEAAEQRIKILNTQSKPWMLTLLTSGTHHPYELPENHPRLPEFSEAENALRYTDTYLNQLLNNLEDSGTLDNTLVIITSDEVKKISGIEGRFSLDDYRSPLIVVTPDKHTYTSDDIYGHIDVTSSILDYIKIPASQYHISGHSIFRSYPNSRNLLVSRDSDIFIISDSDRVLFYAPSNSFSDADNEPESKLVSEIKTVIRSSDLSHTDIKTKYIFSEKNRILQKNDLEITGRPSSIIIGQLSLAAKKGETVIWDFELEADNMLAQEAEISAESTILPVYNNEKFKYIFFDKVSLQKGKKLNIRREYTAEDNISRIDTQFSVDIPAEGTVKLKHAYITIQQQIH